MRDKALLIRHLSGARTNAGWRSGQYLDDMSSVFEALDKAQHSLQAKTGFLTSESKNLNDAHRWGSTANALLLRFLDSQPCQIPAQPYSVPCVYYLPNFGPDASCRTADVLWFGEYLCFECWKTNLVAAASANAYWRSRDDNAFRAFDVQAVGEQAAADIQQIRSQRWVDSGGFEQLLAQVRANRS